MIIIKKQDISYELDDRDKHSLWTVLDIDLNTLHPLSELCLPDGSHTLTTLHAQ